MIQVFSCRTLITKQIADEYRKIIFKTRHRNFRVFLFLLFLFLGTAAVSRLFYTQGVDALSVAMVLTAGLALLMYFEAYRFWTLEKSIRKSDMFQEDPSFTFTFTEGQFERSALNTLDTFAYPQIEDILLSKNLIVLKTGREYLPLDKAGFQGIEPDAFLFFLKEKCPEARVITPGVSALETSRLITGWFFASAAALLILIQAAFLFVGKKHGVEYVADILPYLINITLLLSAFLSSVFLFLHKKRGIIVAAAAFAVLFAVNLAAMFSSRPDVQSVISMSPGYRHELVLKHNVKTGKATVYKPVYLLFARPTETVPYTVQGAVKTQWLASDVCAVTYREPNGKTHQYIGTYGDRGSGISYYYVEAALKGQWMLKGKNTVGKSLTADSTGITLQNGADNIEHFAHGSCVQAGTLALDLCVNGLPRWTIVLNDGCKIGNDGLVSYGGTITLCAVSMDETAPMTYVCTTKTKASSASSSGSQPRNSGVENTTLSDLIKQYPDLSKFTSRQDLVRVLTDSTDYYTIARLAMEENTRQYAVNGYDSDVQINSIQLLAGDSDEFCLGIKSTEKVSKSAESETTDFDRVFRFKKGSGGYLAMRIAYGQDGTSGLKKVSSPALSTAGNADFHYLVPASGK